MINETMRFNRILLSFGEIQFYTGYKNSFLYFATLQKNLCHQNTAALFFSFFPSSRLFPTFNMFRKQFYRNVNKMIIRKLILTVKIQKRVLVLFDETLEFRIVRSV